MSTTLGWEEIGLRLALAVLAGGILGLNRTERGMSAGLRTTLLVCLAATVSMIYVNRLLDLTGKRPDSFLQLDPMRLPLGILTGMGFIGGGAILRRGELVHGVTTAATLWYATVLGLCFGGGQFGLGGAALGLGIGTLWGLKTWETRLAQERRAQLTFRLTDEGPTEEAVRAVLTADGFQCVSWATAFSHRGGSRIRKIRCEIHWRARPEERTPAFVERLAGQPGVLAVAWKT
jgi:putative Mg2+ transporter-C (MgtC) family protein